MVKSDRFIDVIYLFISRLFKKVVFKVELGKNTYFDLDRLRHEIRCQKKLEHDIKEIKYDAHSVIYYGMV